MITNNFISSCAATVIAEFITLPICTIKTIYQSDLKYKSIINVVNDVYTKRGINGFYNATVMALLSQMLSTSTKYTFYSYLKKDRNNLLKNIFNGAVAGFFSTGIVHPVDVVKVHRQNCINFRKELKTVGPKLFYRGYTKSLSKNIILTSIIFPFRDYFENHLENGIISSIISSFIATIILHPIDLLKVRQIGGLSLYDSNIRYYYRGFHVNLMRTLPHFTITMFFIDKFNEILNEKN